MPIGSVYGQVYDEVTEIGIHPCDVTLISYSDEVVDETYENGGYLIDALPGSGYSLKFESPEYETKTISNVELYDYSFTRVDAALKKKEAMTEEDSLDLFMKKAGPMVRARVKFVRNLYKMLKDQEKEEEENGSILEKPYRD